MDLPRRDVPRRWLAGLVATPHRWDQRELGRFMLTFGLISTVFDALTFALLWRVFALPVSAFRTGWFVESLLTELVVALIVRTNRRPWQSRPGALLWWSSLALIAIAMLLPYVPGAFMIGFVPLPLPVLAALVGVTLAYAASTECAKTLYAQRITSGSANGRQ